MRDWVSTLPRTLLACVSLIAFPAAAQAGGLHLQPGIFADPQFDPKVSVSASVSSVNGAAHEYVYSHGGNYKLSELDWQINNLVMLNAEVDVRMTNWFGFKIGGGTKLSGSSELDDYDWIYYGASTWDHWSNSPDTSIGSANRFDLSGNLSLFRHPMFTVDALAGLRWNEYEFTAKGGHYIYSSDATHFRDSTGDFASGLAGISYKQNLLTPYLGLGLSANLGRFKIDASATGSAWVIANTYDEHFLRKDISKTGGLFHDSMHNGMYYDFKFGGAYQYSEAVSFNANWERETYQLVKGQDTVSAIGTGVNGTGGGGNFTSGGPAAGMENSTDRLTVGMTYNLN